MHIPNELKQFTNWVLWKTEKRDGKPTKVPYQTNGIKAESNNPKTWASYDTVSQVHQQLTSKFSGIGFMFGTNENKSGIVFIDLDECRNPETGKLTPEAEQIVREFNSYTEVSPSGMGIHIFIYGSKPGSNCKKTHYADFKCIEIYDKERYSTITGEHLPGTPLTIEARQNALDTLYFCVWPEPSLTYELHQESRPCASGVSNMTDKELLEGAARFKNGVKFQRLWNGDTSDYNGDDSSADQALCNLLAFLCGPDASRIDRLFRQSGLYRPNKWGKREDYRNRTINKALSSVREYYSPGGKNDFFPDQIGAMNGRTKQELAKQEREARQITLITTDQIEHEEIDWLYKPFIARKKRTEFVGNPGEGKSFFIQQILERQDKNSLGHESKSGLRVFYALGKDMSPMEFKDRQVKAGGPYRLLHNLEEMDFDFSSSEDTDKFIELIKPQHIDALILDTRRDFFQGDSFSDEIAAIVSNNLRRIAEELNCAVVTIEHVVKSHTNITTQSIPGSVKWAGKLDQIWYIQKGEGEIFQIKRIKDRCMSGVNFLKCKYVDGLGLVRTDEEFIVKATLSTSAMAETDGPGRPSKATLENALDVLGDLPASFWTRDFKKTSGKQDYTDRTAERMLSLLEDSGKVKPGHKQGLWVKVSAYNTPNYDAFPTQNNFGGSFGGLQNGQNELKTTFSPPNNGVSAKTAYSTENTGGNGQLQGEPPLWKDDGELPSRIIPDSENQEAF